MAIFETFLLATMLLQNKHKMLTDLYRHYLFSSAKRSPIKSCQLKVAELAKLPIKINQTQQYYYYATLWVFLKQ